MVINRWNNLKQLMADTSIDIFRFSPELKRSENEEKRKTQFFNRLKMKMQGGYDCGKSLCLSVPLSVCLSVSLSVSLTVCCKGAMTARGL